MHGVGFPPTGWLISTQHWSTSVIPHKEAISPVPFLPLRPECKAWADVDIELVRLLPRGLAFPRLVPTAASASVWLLPQAE